MASKRAHGSVASNSEVRSKFDEDEWLTMMRKMRQALTVARVSPAKAHHILTGLRKAGEKRKLHGQDVLRVLDWELKNAAD